MKLYDAGFRIKANDCEIPETAIAIQVNLTAVDPTGSGYLSAWPYGESEPSASVMAFSDATTISNSVALKICYHCDRDFYVKIYNA